MRKTKTKYRRPSSKKAKPALNDRIRHVEYYFDRVNEGVVVELLGAQFIYKTDKCEIRHCNYDGEWYFCDD